MKRLVLIWIATLAVMLPVGTGYAQEPGQVVLESLIQREVEVTGEDGKKEIRLVEAGNAIPGDELILTVTYTNTGSEPAENVVLVNPVPEYTEYIGKTAGGDNTALTFSVDGGKTYDIPSNLKLPGDDGKPRMAIAREYGHIRWSRTTPLSPGSSGNVFFRVRLQ